jgi:hypothetical protein
MRRSDRRCGRWTAPCRRQNRQARCGRSGIRRHHDVGIAERDQAARIADGVRAGGTGRDDGMVRAAQLVLDGHLAGSEVDQAAGNEEGRDAARTLVAQRIAGLDDAFEAADAGADEHAGRDLVLVGLRMPAGVGKRHVGRRHRIDDERVDLALFLGLHPLVGIIGAAGAVAERNGTGNLCGEVLDLEGGHPGGAATAFEKPGPGDFGATAKRGYHAGTRDNDAPHRP